MALPTPTAITSPVLYFVAGKRKWVWVPTIATQASPSSAEITAGTDLSNAIVGGSINGFMLTTAMVDAPNAGSTVTPQTRGRTTFGTSSIDFYTSLTGTDVRSLLTDGLTGYVVIFTEGIVTGQKCDVWPVQVLPQQLGEDTEKDGQVTIPFAISGLPSIGVAIPTS